MFVGPQPPEAATCSAQPSASSLGAHRAPAHPSSWQDGHSPNGQAGAWQEHGKSMDALLRAVPAELLFCAAS